MSQIEGNPPISQETQINMSDVKPDTNQEKKKPDLNDIIDGLPNDIKELVDSNTLSLDEMIKTLMYLLLPSVGTSLSQVQKESIQNLIKQLSSNLPQTKNKPTDQSQANANIIKAGKGIEGKDLESSLKSITTPQNATATAGSQPVTLQTDSDDSLYLKSTGMVLEQPSLQNKQAVPPSNENTKIALDAHNKEILALQKLSESGTRVTVDGRTVSIQGLSGALTTDNMVSFVARGDQAFLDNSRAIAANEGYSELGSQQRDEGQGRGQQGSDNKDTDTDDTLFFFEDE